MFSAANHIEKRKWWDVMCIDLQFPLDYVTFQQKSTAILLCHSHNHNILPLPRFNYFLTYRYQDNNKRYIAHLTSCLNYLPTSMSSISVLIMNGTLGYNLRDSFTTLSKYFISLKSFTITGLSSFWNMSSSSWTTFS